MSKKFFNLDLHVSVIEDVATNFRALGHTVESHLMSGHYWALNRPRACKGSGDGHGKVGYGAINLNTWETLFHDFPALEQVKAWQAAHPELNEFDGFIATYPPAFALLYEAFKGKIIMDMPVRYDLHFTHRPEAWEMFNERLGKLTDEGRLIPVANSMYDAAYYEYFTGRKCEYVSSLCSYIDKLAPKWTPTGPKLLAFGEHSGCREAQNQVPGVHFVRDVFRREYKHEDVVKARGIVWIPYNCSIMSFFEHYWLNIPMFVPTQWFLADLWKQNLALSQITWHHSPVKGSNLPRSKNGPMTWMLGENIADPHTEAGVFEWMALYDFYNAAEFPFITYFESWSDLKEKIKTVDFEEISGAMAAYNGLREQANMKHWARIID